MVMRNLKPYKEDNLDNGSPALAAVLRHAREAADSVDEWLEMAAKLLEKNTVWCRHGSRVPKAVECDTVPCPLKNHPRDVLSGIYKAGCRCQWTTGKNVPWEHAHLLCIRRPTETETDFYTGVSFQSYPAS